MDICINEYGEIVCPAQIVTRPPATQSAFAAGLVLAPILEWPDGGVGDPGAVGVSLVDPHSPPTGL